MADTFFFNEYDFGGSDCFTSLLLCDVGVMMGVGAVGERCSSLNTTSRCYCSHPESPLHS